MLTLAATLALPLTTSCKRSPEGPMSCRVDAHDPVFLGAVVVAGAQRAPFKEQSWNPTEMFQRAELSVPRDAPPVVATMTVEFATPCGVKSFPLKTNGTEESRRANPDAYQITVDPAMKVPASVTIWVDAAQEKVKLGDMELARGKNIVSDPTCRAPLSFTVDGAPIGAFKVPGDPKKDGYFVTTRKGVCYSVGLIEYSKVSMGLGSIERRLSGGQVYEISIELGIPYFLKQAPSSKKLAPGTAVQMIRELVEVPCKP